MAQLRTILSVAIDKLDKGYLLTFRGEAFNDYVTEDPKCERIAASDKEALLELLKVKL
jgi:hypothetical protein